MQRLREFFSHLRWRTLAAALGTAIVGLLDMLHVIDLHTLVGLFVSEARVGSVVAILGLIFGVLRLVTSTAVILPKEDADAGEAD